MKTWNSLNLCIRLQCIQWSRAPVWGSAAPGRVEKRRPPKFRVKTKSSLSGRNYFITMHHQAGVNFENVSEVKFSDALLTGTGHRHKRLNRDSPGQTGTYDRSNLNQNLKPGHCPPPLSGPCSDPIEKQTISMVGSCRELQWNMQSKSTTARSAADH